MTMKTIIRIQSITLKNFKGAKNKTINFGDLFTEIYGANGTGKTTIQDAFNFVLFGKDHLGNTRFGIKPYDENNETTDKIESSVEAMLSAGDSNIVISRTIREKWVQKRGSATPVFEGNETIFVWDDVPVSAGEYAKKVSEIIEEETFKIITNPLAFVSLPWEKQRDVLLSIVGGITNDSITKNNKDFQALLEALNGKSLEEFSKSLKAKIKKSKDEIKHIPTRIDEVNAGMPEAIDFEEIEKSIKDKTASLEVVEAKIRDVNLANEAVLKEQSDRRVQISELETDALLLNRKAEQKGKTDYTQATENTRWASETLTIKKSDLSRYEVEVSNVNDRITFLDKQIADTDKSIKKLYDDWDIENSKTLVHNEHLSKCTACNRALEADKIKEHKATAEASFNRAKILAIERIEEAGKQYRKEEAEQKASKEAQQKRLEEGNKTIEAVKLEIASLEKQIADAPKLELQTFIDKALKEVAKEIKAIDDKIKALEVLNSADTDVNDTDAFLAESKEIKASISELEKQLYVKEQIAKSKERIKELEAEENALSKVITDLERTEFSVEAFNRAKIEMLESKVNNLFDYVKFKLFDKQVNGGEKETCEALINGVPFSDANTGSKINAGIDIINTLCDHYKVSAPIFIDNAESVDVVVPLNGQHIKLIKSSADKELRVETDVVSQIDRDLEVIISGGHELAS